MNVRMFKPQFVPLVTSGAKRQTIRPFPQRIPRKGEMESWREWTGLPYRSKQREIVRVELTLVREILIILEDGRFEMAFVDKDIRRPLLIEECVEIAKLDGFSSLMEMLRWFRVHYTFPFRGVLIRAKDLPANQLAP
jgi:hypothetical protein